MTLTAGYAQPQPTHAQPVAPVRPLEVPPSATSVRSLDVLLNRLVAEGASDLHLAGNTFPWMTQHGIMLPMSGLRDKILSPQVLEQMLFQVVSRVQWDSYKRLKRLDFSYETSESRFRGHFAVSGGGHPMAVFRAISREVPNMDDLGLPPIVSSFGDAEAGLYVFVGVTNSGKSSSLSALIKEIKTRHAKKIITIEAPVEQVHDHGKSMVIQREVGVDVDSFEIGIEDAMREAPDIIMVGEMRDPATMQMALRAATSGHVVFTTLHAMSTTDAPMRILDSMPPERVSETRAMLSRTLKAVVYQKLLPRRGGGGRELAAEVLNMDPAISNMIRTDNLEGIAGRLNDRESGNIPFEASLAGLVLDGKVNEKTAEAAELKPGSFDRAYKAGRRY